MFDLICLDLLNLNCKREREANEMHQTKYLSFVLNPVKDAKLIWKKNNLVW